MIHLHERRGLIQSIRRGKGGNRYFHKKTVFQLQKIKQLQAIGLSLHEIGEVLPLYIDGDDNGVSGKKAALTILHRHLEEADNQLKQVTHLREEILKSIARMELLIEQHHQ